MAILVALIVLAVHAGCKEISSERLFNECNLIGEKIHSLCLRECSNYDASHLKDKIWHLKCEKKNKMVIMDEKLPLWWYDK